MNADYRTLLKQTLAERARVNPRYSLRAFARDLGISAPRLSMILNGKSGLSKEAASQIAKKLGLTDQESMWFCNQVEAMHARASIQRNFALKRIEAEQKKFNSLSIDSFKVISDWYHYAIMELCLTEDFKYDPLWIAKRLGVPQYEIECGIERLIAMDLLKEENGTIRPTGSFFASANGAPSDALRKFHSQLLDRAKQAIVLQSVDKRNFSNITVAIDPDDYEMAIKQIKKFRDRLAKKLAQGKRKRAVYQLSIQLFNLETEERRTK